MKAHKRRLMALWLINGAEFARNAATRIPVRLLLEKRLESVYNKFARGGAGTA